MTTTVITPRIAASRARAIETWASASAPPIMGHVTRVGDAMACARCGVTRDCPSLDQVMAFLWEHRTAGCSANDTNVMR